MTASNFGSLTAAPSRRSKSCSPIEGKLNFGLSIIIVLSILTLIALFWPETGV
jgi:hypothetical protein